MAEVTERCKSYTSASSLNTKSSNYYLYHGSHLEIVIASMNVTCSDKAAILSGVGVSAYLSGS